MVGSHAYTSASLIASIAPSISSHLIHLTPSPFSIPPPSTGSKLPRAQVSTLRLESSDPVSSLVRAGHAVKAKKGADGEAEVLPATLLMRFDLGTALRMVPRFKDLVDLPIVIFLSATSGASSLAIVVRSFGS